MTNNTWLNNILLFNDFTKEMNNKNKKQVQSKYKVFENTLNTFDVVY